VVALLSGQAVMVMPGSDGYDRKTCTERDH